MEALPRDFKILGCAHPPLTTPEDEGNPKSFYLKYKMIKRKKSAASQFRSSSILFNFFFCREPSILAFFLEIWRRETRKVINIQKDLLSTNKHMGASIFLFHLSINAELVVMKRKIFRSFF